MSGKIYTDDNIGELLRQTTGIREVYPRPIPYSDDPNHPQYAAGGIPVGAYQDQLVDPKDFKEVIDYCHREKIFPIYHQYASWAPPGFRWSQSSIPYCWAWGATAALMDCRAREGKETKLLSPVSLGFTVNWQNRGNYLESAIRGIMSRGVCEMSYTPDMHSRNYRQYKDGWEENALNYRLAEYWDCDGRSETKMAQHIVSVLRTGTPLYIAHNWWGHALEICSVEWDERQQWNLIFVHRNSHNESDVIRLTGSRGCPDEAYGFRSTKTRLA